MWTVKERGEVEDGVDVDGELAVDDGELDELHAVVEVLGRAEVGVVDRYHVVVGCEAVREVRAKEARAARGADAFISDTRVSSETTV
jgi:hypothetical protein